MVDESPEKGDVMGTPCYIAPEILSDPRKICFKTDVWAFGVILFISYFGELPFNHDDINEMYKIILRGEYSFPDRIEPDLKDLITNIFRVDLERRFDINQVLSHR